MCIGPRAFKRDDSITIYILVSNSQREREREAVLGAVLYSIPFRFRPETSHEYKLAKPVSKSLEFVHSYTLPTGC